LETFKELKAFCDEKIKDYPELEKKYRKEIIIAKRFYDNDKNLFKELNKKKDKISKRYIIPFLLGLTDEVIDKEWEYTQVKSGASGGVDIDSDFSTEAKIKVQDYLLNKYGKDCVLHVGTFNRLGCASAAKDLLRIYKVDYKESNSFTTSLDANLSWEENIKMLQEKYPAQYNFYLDNKKVLDMVPFFVDKVRQTGKHAGGIVILPEPVFNYIPIERVKGEIATAFPESAQEQVLDEIGVVKYDILGITILDVIKNAIDLIDEKLFLIEEDGIKKIVPQSYIDKEIGKY
jgi:hypothetical protein